MLAVRQGVNVYGRLDDPTWRGEQSTLSSCLSISRNIQGARILLGELQGRRGVYDPTPTTYVSSSSDY